MANIVNLINGFPIHTTYLQNINDDPVTGVVIIEKNNILNFVIVETNQEYILNKNKITIFSSIIRLLSTKYSGLNTSDCDIEKCFGFFNLEENNYKSFSLFIIVKSKLNNKFYTVYNCFSDFNILKNQIIIDACSNTYNVPLDVFIKNITSVYDNSVVYNTEISLIYIDVQDSKKNINGIKMIYGNELKEKIKLNEIKIDSELSIFPYPLQDETPSSIVSLPSDTDDAKVEFSSGVCIVDYGEEKEKEYVVTPKTIVYNLNLPMITLTDNDSGFYQCVGTTNSLLWTGCNITMSSDGMNYSDYATYNSNDIIISGFCNNVLGNGSSVVFDRLNYAIVKVFNDTTKGNLFSSKTKYDIYNGENLILIGDELIKFCDVEYLGNNIYKFYNLLRGCFGTDYYIDSHISNEKFIYLGKTLDNIRRVEKEYPISNLGLYRFFMSKTNGDVDGLISSFGNKCSALIPYAPCHCKMIKQSNGNIIINWKRRTRFNGGWKDYDDIPLNEIVESYDILIYDKYNEVLKRQYIDKISPTITYSYSERMEDFNNEHELFYIRIYQKSNIVGRGIPLIKKCDIDL